MRFRNSKVIENEDFDNIYELLEATLDEEPDEEINKVVSKIRIQHVTSEITAALVKTAIKIQKLGEEYPSIGIGDTATDEAIAAHFYRMIHWNEDLPDPANKPGDGIYGML